jgi:formate hydrogenlyase subunit 6/NADH:ubiquinone oxidoreductase subunit I
MLDAQEKVWAVRVTDVCVVCGGCAQVCPTNALTLQDDVANICLHLDPNDCTGCETCLDACALDAITSDWADAQAGIVATSEWAHCQNCDKIMATRAEVNTMRERLQAAGFPSALLDMNTKYCPHCKYTQAGMPKGH